MPAASMISSLWPSQKTSVSINQAAGRRHMEHSMPLMGLTSCQKGRESSLPWFGNSWDCGLQQTRVDAVGRWPFDHDPSKVWVGRIEQVVALFRNDGAGHRKHRMCSAPHPGVTD